jgi:hypothetical protein
MPAVKMSEEEYQAMMEKSGRQDPAGTYAEQGQTRPSGAAPADRSNERPAEEAMQQAEFSEWEQKQGYDKGTPKSGQTGYENLKGTVRDTKEKIHDVKERAKGFVREAKENPRQANTTAASKVGSLLDQLSSGNFGSQIGTFRKGVSDVNAKVKKERAQPPVSLFGFPYPGGVLSSTGGLGRGRAPVRRVPARRQQAPTYRSTKWSPGIFTGGRAGIVSITPEHGSLFDMSRHPVSVLSGSRNGHPFDRGFSLGFELMRPATKTGKKATHPFNTGFKLHFSGMGKR